MTHKYRAWDDKAKKWLLDLDYEEIGGFSMTGEIMLTGAWQDILERNLRGEIDLKVMASTGSTDKNKKEIYVGDIVEWLDRKGEVYAKHGEFCIKWRECGDAFNERLSVHSNLQVIGNIYQNPELVGNK